MSLAQATAKLVSSISFKRDASHTATQCFICEKAFSLIRRQHKCKNCLKAVCADCGTNKLPVPKYDKTNKPHRVCSSCYYTMPGIRKAPPIHKYTDYAFNMLLTDPTQYPISVWFKTFHKCWLRSKYFSIYQQKQKELLEKASILQPKKKEPQLFRQKKVAQTIDYGNNTTGSNDSIFFDNNSVVIIDAGQLWINIMDAINVPNNEISALDKPSCYCVLYVTNNDKCFADNNKYRTKTCKNTIHPTWNEDKIIKLTNSTGILVIELWATDMADRYLGRLEIKLNSLFLHFYHYEIKEENNKNRIIDDWFEIDILEKWRKNITSQSVDATKNNESVQDESENVPIYTKLKSVPNIKDSNSKYGKYNNKCYIRLQLQIDSNWWAHFISHFDPVLKKPYQVKFNLPLTIEEINKFSKDWGTTIGEWNNEQKQILTWFKYKWSVIYLILFTYFIYHPWFAMFYLELRLLIYFCHVYVNLNESTKKQINLPAILHWMCLFFGYIQIFVEKIIVQTLEIDNKLIEENSVAALQREESEHFLHETMDETLTIEETKEKEKESEISMSAFGEFAARKAISVSGIKPKLWWFQEYLVFINDALDNLQYIISWHVNYAHITSLLCVVLFILCIVSVIFRDTDFVRHEIYVIGILMLSYYSKPMQFILWMISGTTYWYFNFYRRYNQFIQQDKELFSSKIINNENDVPVQSVKNKKYMEKISYLFVKLWIKMNAFIVWIIMKVFSRAEAQIIDNNQMEIKMNDLKKEKSGKGDKKAERRRLLILRQFQGGFDKKFQFLMSRLKNDKFVTF